MSPFYIDIPRRYQYCEQKPNYISYRVKPYIPQRTPYIVIIQYMTEKYLLEIIFLLFREFREIKAEYEIKQIFLLYILRSH